MNQRYREAKRRGLWQLRYIKLAGAPTVRVKVSATAHKHDPRHVPSHAREPFRVA